MNKISKYLTNYDKILITIILIFSFIMIIYPFINAYFSSNDNNNSYIYIKGTSNDIQKIPLSDTYSDEPIIIEIEGPLGISVVEAHMGKVRLKEAPEEDPAKICEKTGWISKPGPSIICVPNKVSIWIEQENSELDAVSW